MNPDYKDPSDYKEALDQVAKLLGGTYRHEEKYPTGYIDLDGLSITVRTINSRHDTRLHFSYVAPQDNQRRGYYISDLRTDEFSGKSEITVDAGRDPAAIAENIRRRLLPDLQTAFVLLRARIAASNEYADRTEANLVRLEKLLGGKRSPNAEHAVFPSKVEGLYKIRVHGDSVTIETYSLTIDRALKLLEYWKKI